MNRAIIVAALVGLAIVGIFACRPAGPAGTGQAQWPNEYATIVVTDHQGTCKVRVRRPQTIYTESNSTVTWRVVGRCEGAPPVEIDRRFQVEGGGTQDIFTPSSSLKTTAQNGNRITGTLLDGLTPNKKRVHYEYTILINGQPAEYASRADAGAFEVCPDWPCS